MFLQSDCKELKNGWQFCENMELLLDYDGLASGRNDNYFMLKAQ